MFIARSFPWKIEEFRNKAASIIRRENISKARIPLPFAASGSLIKLIMTIVYEIYPIEHNSLKKHKNADL